MNTTWHIEANSADTELGWSVVGTSLEAAWPYFFSCISLQKYPELINAATKEVGYDSNGIGVSFPADVASLDPLNSSLAPDAVEVYVPGFEDSILPRATFYSILLAFGEHLLKQPNQTPVWYEAQRQALAELKNKGGE